MTEKTGKPTGERLSLRDLLFGRRVDLSRFPLDPAHAFNRPRGGSSETPPGAPPHGGSVVGPAPRQWGKSEAARAAADRDRAARDRRAALDEAAEIVRARAATYRRNAAALDRLTGSPLVIDPETWRREADRLDALALRL